MVNPLLYNQAGNKNPAPNPPSLYMMFYVFNKEKMINRKEEVRTHTSTVISRASAPGAISWGRLPEGGRLPGSLR